MPDEALPPGMGALPHPGGVAFRVWAPHAEAVHVTGSFNDWSEDACPLALEGNGVWAGNAPEARPGSSTTGRPCPPSQVRTRTEPWLVDRSRVRVGGGSVASTSR